GAPGRPRPAGPCTCRCGRRRGHLCGSSSQHLWGERDDAHELLVPQLPADRAEDTGAARLELLVDEHRGVLVEADVTAVGPALLLLRAHDDAADHVALFHRGPGDGVFDRGDEDVADAGVATAR